MSDIKNLRPKSIHAMIFANGFHQVSIIEIMNMTKQLSESLLAACKAAGIEEPKYIAQDENGTVWHYDGEPDTTYTSDVGIFAFAPDIGEHAISLDHPRYADHWQDSLLQWVDHVADASKMVDDACKIAYHAHIENGNGFSWSRLDCYRAAWQDALAWKAMAEKGGEKL